MTTQEIQTMLDNLDNYRAAVDALTMEKQALIDSVLTAEIKAKLAEIDAEFAPMLERVNEQAGELEARIKDAVIASGATVKGTHLQAVYAKGRVSWDTAKLDGLMIVIPQLKEARKEGQPSVSIRVNR